MPNISEYSLGSADAAAPTPKDSESDRRQRTRDLRTEQVASNARAQHLADARAHESAAAPVFHGEAAHAQITYKAGTGRVKSPGPQPRVIGNKED